MAFLDDLVRNVQGAGRNLLQGAANIPTPFSAGIKGSDARLTLGDIAANLGQSAASNIQARSYTMPKTRQEANQMLTDPNSDVFKHNIDLAAGSANGESKFAGAIGNFVRSKTVEDVAKGLAGMFGDAAKKISPDIVQGLQKATDPAQVQGLLKQAGSMVQLHGLPLADEMRQAVTKELQSVGEHDAAVRASQAQTHGDLVDALRGTQLHPEAPTAAPYQIKPAIPLHPEGTLLSEMNPAAMAQAQAQTAEQNMHVINANRLLAEKQAQAPRVQMPQAGDLMAGKMEQLKARQANYKQTEAGLKDAELAARDANAPALHEMKQMDANAAIPKPPTEPIKVPPRVPEPKTGPVNLDKLLPKKEMGPKETGSAHENQGATPKPEPANKPFPEPVGRTGKLDNGEATYQFHRNAAGDPQIIKNDNTGEVVHEKLAGGDIYSRVHNQILDRAENGKGSRDPIKILTGRQKSGEALGKMLDKQITTDLPNIEDRRLLSHHLEDPSVKVPDHVQRVADQVRPIRDLALHVRQSVNPEVRGVEHYMTHMVEQPKPGATLRGEGKKVSTYSTANQGRVMYHMTDKSGNSELRHLDDLVHVRKNFYHDPETGKLLQAGRSATIKDLQGAGMKVEDDSAKILGRYASDTNRVKENAHLITSLKNDPQFKGKVIPPGVKLTPAQQLGRYRTVNIRGLEGYRMPNKLAFQLEGAMKSGKGTNLLLKGYDKASNAVTRTIFYNMVTHPINMLTNFAVGSGSLSKFGPLGTVRALKQVIPAVKMIHAQDADFIRLQNAGAGFGGFGSGKPGMMQRLGEKVAGEIGAKVGGNIDKANVIRQWYRANTAVIGHVDDALRGSLILAKEKQLGGDTAKAVKLVDKFMVDYGNSGAFEKKVVSRFFNFYPWVKGNMGIVGHMVAHPAQNAGAITNLALMGAAWYELNQAWKKYTDNPKASVRPPGVLGIINDGAKTVKGIVDGKPREAAGTLINHLNPLLKEGASQVTGQDIGTGQDLVMKNGKEYKAMDNSTYTYQGKNGKDQNNRLTHAASNLVAPLKPVIDIAKEKKSPTEFALNQLGLNTPHASNQKAAPGIGDGQLLSGINTVKGGSKNSVDTAAAYKAAGGNKLLAYQIMRSGGDHSMDAFFSKDGNSKLDPLSKDFKGYANQSGSSVSIGKDLNKKLGGNSLTYMQSQKEGGSSTYDKFFKQHPELDPTNPQFQGFKKSSSGASKANAGVVKYQNFRTKASVSRAKATGHVKGLKTAKSVSVGLKHASLRPTASTKSTKLVTPRVKAAPTTKIRIGKSVKTPGVKLRLKA